MYSLKCQVFPFEFLLLILGDSLDLPIPLDNSQLGNPQYIRSFFSSNFFVVHLYKKVFC